MTIIIILGVTAFLASIWGVWQAIKSVSEGSNFDEDWGSIQHYNQEKFDDIFKKK